MYVTQCMYIYGELKEEKDKVQVEAAIVVQEEEEEEEELVVVVVIVEITTKLKGRYHIEFN